MKALACLLTFAIAAPTLAQVDPSSGTNPTGFAKLETVYSTRDLDAEAINAINKRMTNDGSMKNILPNISVSSRDQVIYVSGRVLSNTDRLKVLDHARSISAANRVVDQLEVGPAPTPEPASLVQAPAQALPVVITNPPAAQPTSTAVAPTEESTISR